MWTKQFIQRFLYTWVPLVLIVAAVLGLLHRNEVNAQLTITRTNEQQAVQLANQTITTELEMLRGDTLYLAELSSLYQWLDFGKASDRTHFTSDLLTFSRRRGLYEQVRFLDEHGREVVRINWNHGRPQVVPDDKLQDKSERYYVRNALALDEHAVYFSPFDLNVEHGVIEQPVAPMIRLGTPVFDHQGRKRGVIMLNYMGQRLLNRLREIRSQHGDNLWLLNGEGYWLLGPRPEMEWGFMYPGRKTMRFEHEYGDVWASLQTGPRRSQLVREDGMYTYARIEPGAALADKNRERWILVSHISAANLTANLAENTSNLVMTFVVLTALLALISGVLAYYGVQRQQTETLMRESEARFRGLLNSAPDAIIILNDAGRITLINSQAENWFGYSRDELLGEAVEKLVPERFRTRHVTDRETYIANPVARPMGKQAELNGLRKDGSEFPVEISLSPVVTGKGLLVTSIIRDISARKHAEDVKQQVQARYHDLVNNLPVGVYRNTPGVDGCFLEVNPAMVGMFEAESIEELVSHAVSDLYCDPASRKAFVDKIMEQGYVKGEELNLKTLRGREFCAAITAVKKEDADGNIYFDGIVEDISVRKEHEHRIQQLNENLRARSIELEAINQELETFSYSVSHDLRAPLRAMDGFSSSLLTDYADQLDDKGRDRLNRVRAAAQRMAALIDDLLKLSRISRAELKCAPVDLSQITNEIMETLRRSEPQRSVGVSVQPQLITEGDARLLRVVMDNLLGNAWKFTGRRPDAAIEVGGKAEGKKITYYIRDNGAGFDMAYANKLFGAFQRLHDSGEFPGTGIGLATVQRVIHKHGGHIWAESEPGKGATFYFTLNEQGKA